MNNWNFTGNLGRCRAALHTKRRCRRAILRGRQIRLRRQGSDHLGALRNVGQARRGGRSVPDKRPVRIAWRIRLLLRSANYKLVFRSGEKTQCGTMYEALQETGDEIQLGGKTVFVWKQGVGWYCGCMDTQLGCGTKSTNKRRLIMSKTPTGCASNGNYNERTEK